MTKCLSSDPRAPLARLSIDVTETLATGKWTGIERVVRRLSTEMQRVEAPPPIRLVIARKGRFFELNQAGAAQFLHPAAINTGGRTSRTTRTIGTLLSNVPPILFLVQSILKERKFGSVFAPLVRPEPVDFGPGDAILLLDSYWAGTSAIAAARQARNAGAAVVATIYDLIPITHPQYMPRSLTKVFPKRIRQALMVSDGAIAISRYSADELRQWLGERLPQLPIEPFRLGNDPASSCNGAASPFARRYAMVGTIEPRKRHDLVLDAFERRWAAGVNCQLTIVGRIGWASDTTRSRLTALAAQGRVQLIHDADDTRLAAILAETDAVIMASEIEGFGLPIVEALALGIPVIASDIPVFREVGDDAIIPFDPNSVAALILAMERLEADPDHWRSRARTYTWPSWNAAARQLLVTLKTMLSPPSGVPSSLD